MKIEKSLETVQRKVVFPTFKKLNNLHLELLEIKEKLKPGVPDIVIKLKSSKKESENVDKIEFNEDSHRRHKHRHDKHRRDDDEDSEHSRHSRKKHKHHDDEPEENYEEYEEEKPKEEEPEEPDEDSDDEKDTRTPEEIEMEERTEFYWRFKILKKAYPKRTDIVLPEDHEDITVIKKNYAFIRKEIDLETSLDKYEKYLGMAWIIMEFCFIKYLNVDMKGFAAEQIRNREQYNLLLFELGEKYYDGYESKWSVEMRLVGLVLFQTFAFFVMKHIGNQLGDGVASMLSGLLGNKAEIKKPKKAEVDEEEIDMSEPVQKKRMKGPQFSFTKKKE